jgi:sarcosine oxidase subunit beta
MERRAQIVVVGGGVHGASLLYHLARLGGKDLLLLERREPGAGATGKSTSIVRHHYSNEICVRITLASRKVFEAFREEVGQTIPYTHNSMLFCVGEQDEGALRENVAMQRRCGVRVELMEATEAVPMAPYLNPEGLTMVAHDVEAGYSDAKAVALAYLRAAEALGAKVLTGVTAKAVSHASGRTTGVETTAGPMRAPVVVDAAGPWAGEIAATAGVHLPLEPTRLMVGQFATAEPFSPREPTIISLPDLLYWRPWEGGTLAVGDDEEIGGSFDMAHLDEGVDQAFEGRILQRLAPRAHGLGGLGLVKGWSGYDGVTPDVHPILDRVGPEGFYVAAGFSGHGFKFAPLAGRCMAELVFDGKFRSMDLTPFRLARFAEGETFRSRYAMSVTQ